MYRDREGGRWKVLSMMRNDIAGIDTFDPTGASSNRELDFENISEGRIFDSWVSSGCNVEMKFLRDGCVGC